MPSAEGPPCQAARLFIWTFHGASRELRVDRSAKVFDPCKDILQELPIHDHSPSRR